MDHPLDDLSAARVLITQAHLVQYMGSEVVTLELAEFFAGLGAEVLILTHSYGWPIRAEFERLAVRVFEIDDPQFDMELKARPPDLAWIHHHVIPERLLRNPGSCRFVFNHMSGVTPGELPLSIAIERGLASVSLFVSPEARDAQVSAGNFEEFPQERLQIWANPAPAAFSSVSRGNYRGGQIAVVSNHIPPELVAAVDLLREKYSVELIGSQSELGAKPRRITASEMSSLDAVITIGKTVQYALSAGVPVYCYDHFGGPGWITQETIDAASYVNFSGRKSVRKSPSEIVNEIEIGLQSASLDAMEHRFERARLFSLPMRWGELARFLRDKPRHSHSVKNEEVRSFVNTQLAFTAYIRQWLLARGDAEHRQTLIRDLEVLVSRPQELPPVTFRAAWNSLIERTLGRPPL